MNRKAAFSFPYVLRYRRGEPHHGDKLQQFHINDIVKTPAVSGDFSNRKKVEILTGRGACARKNPLIHFKHNTLEIAVIL